MSMEWYVRSRGKITVHLELIRSETYHNLIKRIRIYARILHELVFSHNCACHGGTQNRYVCINEADTISNMT